MTGSHQQTAEALSADLYTGAMLILLTEDGTLGERLARAYVDMAGHAAPLAAQMPTELGQRVLRLHRALTGGAEPGLVVDDAAVRRCIDTMSQDERIRAASDVAELAGALDLEVRSARESLHTVP